MIKKNSQKSRTRTEFLQPDKRNAWTTYKPVVYSYLMVKDWIPFSNERNNFTGLLLIPSLLEWNYHSHSNFWIICSTVQGSTSFSYKGPDNLGFVAIWSTEKAATEIGKPMGPTCSSKTLFTQTGYSLPTPEIALLASPPLLSPM